MNIEIMPTKEQMKSWINKYVPDKDFFFVDESGLSNLKGHLSDVLVIPKEEFFNRSSYKQIDLANSYMYWNISSKAKFVIVANPSWITNLSEQKAREIFEMQFTMGRGLIFPLGDFPQINIIPKDYIVSEKDEEYVVIQQDMWKAMHYAIKEDLLLTYAKLWDDWTCCEIPKQTPLHIRNYTNKFTTLSGSNCLAATLFAVTEQDWILDEWVHQETFKFALESAGYVLLNNDELSNGDVIAWVDSDNVIQHASYHISNNFFFNKNGQTFFNPWTVTHYNQLSKRWQKYNMVIYRKR
ncbi:hypothetical protein WAK64_05080 [Bacillus spongiae]|uniref:NlpC/P60 domain-containing protein n=1 Tax=Bacillus spongiae TaxID=2683610 RepID=A0ABU8HAT7_9BACI